MSQYNDTLPQCLNTNDILQQCLSPMTCYRNVSIQQCYLFTLLSYYRFVTLPQRHITASVQYCNVSLPQHHHTVNFTLPQCHITTALQFRMFHCTATSQFRMPSNYFVTYPSTLIIFN